MKIKYIDNVPFHPDCFLTEKFLKILKMKKKPLTPKQQEVYKFILDQYMPFGEVPSLQLIAAHFGKSKSTISQFVQQLAKKGYIRKRPYEKIRII